MLNWPALKELALNTSQRTVSLSGMSKVLIDATYFDLYNMTRWKGEGYELTDVEIDEIKEAVDRLVFEIERSKLIGMVFPLVRVNLPENCLWCDGSSHNRVDWPELYDLLPAGLHVNADVFNTPTIQNRVVVATGATFPLYTTGGAQTVSLTAAQNGAHTHTEIVVGSTLGVVGEIPALVATAAPGVTGSSGSGSPHENMPPYVSLPYAILGR